MTSRSAGLGVLGAAGVAGMSFASAFAAGGIVLPVLAVLVPVAVVDLATRGRLEVLRAPLGLLGGAAAGWAVLTGWAGLTGGASAAPVLRGVRDGWLRTLESTLPARADPELVAFVPALVLLTAVVGLEWLRRGTAPLATLAPSAAVLVVAQLYQAATGGQAIALACGYGLAAAVVLGAAEGGRVPGAAALAALVLPLVLVAAGAGAALAVVDPVGRAPFSAADRYPATVAPGPAANPLTELGGRLSRPDDVAFTVRTTAPVDRWPLVVLDGFDGTTFTSSARYRPLGAELSPDPAVTASTLEHTADVTVAPGWDGPWLPTQFRTTAVDGLRPAVDPVTGTLVRPGTGPTAGYRLRWRAPTPDRDDLVGAPVDLAAPTVDVAGVPAAIAETAAQVVGGAPPSFPAALALERWFRDTFAVATGDELPTGHGTTQLLHFLDVSKRGTSEQFAATYVLMARSVGIPVRLVVGFRQPTPPDAQGGSAVRNRDVLAWPEVAVPGVGWVALDPTGDARPDETPGSIASAAQAAREELPRTDLFPAPEPAPVSPAGARPVPPRSQPLLVLGAGALGLLVVGMAAVPAAKRVRRARRRRGGAAAVVVGAWRETRDLLRDHGAPVSAGMTVRDLRAPAAALLGHTGPPGPEAELDRLARCVDSALYAPAAVDHGVAEEAWEAASAVAAALARRPLPARFSAALRIGTLRIRPGRIRPGRIRLGRIRLGRIRPGRSGAGHSGAGHSGAGRTGGGGR